MTLRVLWFAIFGSTVMFLVVGLTVIQERSDMSEPNAILLPVIGLSAVAAAGLSLIVPRQVLRRSLRALGLRTQELPREELMFNDGKRHKKRFVDPAEARSRLMLPVQKSVILGLALAESVALHGFLLWFLGFGFAIGLGLFALSWVLMLAQFPKLEVYERELTSVYDAELS